MSDVNGFTVFGVIVAIALCYSIVTFVFAGIICGATDDLDMFTTVMYMTGFAFFIVVSTLYILGVPCPIKI